MREDANSQYLAVLAALGAHIESNKNSLAFAKHEIDGLKKKLAEANQEIAELSAFMPKVEDKKNNK